MSAGRPARRPLSAGGPARPVPSAVLFLHGQPGGGRDWDRVATALSGRAPLVAVDRPGWDRRTDACDLECNARAALSALDARGTDRAIVVGHSYGGAVAAWLAAAHPERVAALVLAAPSANLASLNALDRALAAPVLGDVLSAAALAGPALAFGIPWCRHAIAARLDLDERYLRRAGRALLEPRAWRSFATEQRALFSDLPLLEARLADVVAATTIVIGSRDVVVPIASARLLASQIPGASFTVLEGAGHLLPLRHASRLADVILLAFSSLRSLS